MQQSIQRIDHVAIIVKQENAYKLADRLSAALGITFSEPLVNEAYGLLIIVSWDAGLEVMAPTREEGPYWERIQRHGEGAVSIVFGVADMDDGARRARESGVEVSPEAKLNGNEPWLERFSTFREARLGTFGLDLACSLTLSEIVPAAESADCPVGGSLVADYDPSAGRPLWSTA
jgi:Glyoxalase/Bleomycin resistance protein/Dioxygenase superfamily